MSTLSRLLARAALGGSGAALLVIAVQACGDDAGDGSAGGPGASGAGATGGDGAGGPGSGASSGAGSGASGNAGGGATSAGGAGTGGAGVCDQSCDATCQFMCGGGCPVCHWGCSSGAQCGGDCTGSCDTACSGLDTQCTIVCLAAAASDVCNVACTTDAICQVVYPMVKNGSVSCTGGAACILHCTMGGAGTTCTFDACDGPTTVCSDTSVACNIDCP